LAQGPKDVGAGGPEVGIAVVSWKYILKVTVIEASVITLMQSQTNYTNLLIRMAKYTSEWLLFPENTFFKVTVNVITLIY
jgi:hypothetical protein